MTLLEYINRKANDHGRLSREYMVAGNQSKADAHALVSNECEDILDFNERHPELTGIETRTTRYMAKDGRERAVLLWEDYEHLLEVIRLRDSKCSLAKP